MILQCHTPLHPCQTSHCSINQALIRMRMFLEHFGAPLRLWIGSSRCQRECFRPSGASKHSYFIFRQSRNYVGKVTCLSSHQIVVTTQRLCRGGLVTCKSAKESLETMTINRISSSPLNCIRLDILRKAYKFGLLWLLEAAHAYPSRNDCMTDGVDAHRCPFPETSALNMLTEAVGASPAGKDRQGL